MLKIFDIILSNILARFLWMLAGIILIIIGLISPTTAENAIRQANKVL